MRNYVEKKIKLKLYRIITYFIYWQQFQSVRGSFGFWLLFFTGHGVGVYWGKINPKRLNEIKYEK